MRKFLLAAVATAAIASPAMARDGSPYVGVDFGILAPRNTNMDVDANFPVTTNPVVPSGVTHYNEGFDVDYKNGFDGDIVGGYDLGMFRIEGEVAYKHASIKDVDFDEPFLFGINGAYGINPALTNDTINMGGHVNVLSGMINGLVDFEDGSWGGFVGGGAGLARVRLLGDSDSAVAFQGIAGVRAAVSENIDVGLKYRYFRTARLNFDSDFTFGSDVLPYSSKGRFESHSLMLSLSYNFYSPPPPPPPPATQTCPDGSVILATDTCPAPPPPPPPPPPAPERG